MSSAPAQPNSPVSTQPTAMDWLFLLSCAVALIVVAWFGKMAYTEANKTETAKRNGEAVVTWMQKAAAAALNPTLVWPPAQALRHPLLALNRPQQKPPTPGAVVWKPS